MLDLGRTSTCNNLCLLLEFRSRKLASLFPLFIRRFLARPHGPTFGKQFTRTFIEVLYPSRTTRPMYQNHLTIRGMKTNGTLRIRLVHVVKLPSKACGQNLRPARLRCVLCAYGKTCGILGDQFLPLISCIDFCLISSRQPGSGQPFHRFRS